MAQPQLRRLLAVCNGKDFEARRDTTIILLVDAGPRRAEFAGMRVKTVSASSSNAAAAREAHRRMSPRDGL